MVRGSGEKGVKRGCQSRNQPEIRRKSFDNKKKKMIDTHLNLLIENTFLCVCNTWPGWLLVGMPNKVQKSRHFTQRECNYTQHAPMLWWGKTRVNQKIVCNLTLVFYCFTSNYLQIKMSFSPSNNTHNRFSPTKEKRVQQPPSTPTTTGAQQQPHHKYMHICYVTGRPVHCMSYVINMHNYAWSETTLLRWR